MHPDPRLLLPASAVERAPWGVREVLRCDVCGEAQTHYSGCDAPAEGDHCTSMNDCAGRAARYLDLSAPVDGERLDALPWAIDTLADTFGGRGSVRLAQVSAGCGYMLSWSGGGAAIVPPDTSTAYLEGFTAGGTRGTVLHVDVDLSDLTPGDAARAVVVAALVARGGARG